MFEKNPFIQNKNFANFQSNTTSKIHSTSKIKHILYKNIDDKGFI